MLIWRNYKPYTEAIENLNLKRCWSYCYNCKKRWGAIETTNVHLLRVRIQKNSETRFACDSCLPELIKSPLNTLIDASS